MTEEQFKERTKKVALEIIFLVDSLPDTIIGDVIGNQVLRSGTSIGLNYRAACRAKSTSDMILKLQIVLEGQTEKVAQQTWPSPPQPPEVTVTLEVTVTSGARGCA